MHDEIDVEGCPDGCCRRIGNQQPSSAAPDEYQLLSQRPERRRHNFYAFEVGVQRSH